MALPARLAELPSWRGFLLDLANGTYAASSNFHQPRDTTAEIDGTDKRPGILPVMEESPYFGPTHPSTLTTRHLRASILQDLGRYDRALAEIDGTDKRPGILLAMEQSPDRGPTHPSTLSTRSLRGAILSDLGHCEESERELRSAGAEQEQALGPVHASTLRSGHRLATTLVALGRFGEAGELLRTVIAGRRESLGDEHPDTRAAIADLETLRQKQSTEPVVRPGGVAP